MGKTREELFAALVRKYQDALLAFVYSCVRARDAACDVDNVVDEVIRDTLFTAWRKFDEYDSDRPFDAWLRGIARNVTRAHLRRVRTTQRRVHSLPPEAVAAIADEHGRSDRPARDETYCARFAALRECLEALPREDRKIIEDVYRWNQTCRITAGRTKQTVGAIRKRLQRVRAWLRDCIQGKLGAEVAGG